MTATPRQNLETLVTTDGLTRATPPILLPANPYFDLAGEEFGRRLLLTSGSDGIEYCIRPDFTLPLAQDWLATAAGRPAAMSYLGTVFRQRETGPAEFQQAGIELIAQPDPDAALDRVFDFALNALAAYGVTAPRIRLGSVALFEAVLAGADMPDVWRPRLRHRFGHPQALALLLDRLNDPHGANGNGDTRSRAEMIEDITGQMVAAGLSITEGRRPEEIADRYYEKQALARAHVPEKTVRMLRDYLAIAGEPEAALAQIVTLAEVHELSTDSSLKSITRHAENLASRAPESDLVFETGFSPRLDYYTGLVFEFSGKDSAVLVSGGQYDRLLQRLGAKEEIAASGCAVWVDRLAGEEAR